MLYDSILESVEDLHLKQQIHLVNILNEKIIIKKRILIRENAETALNDFQHGILFEETAENLIVRLSGK